MINAKNTTMNQSVASENVFQPLHPDTGDEHIIASNSTCYTLLMERGHPGTFLFPWRVASEIALQPSHPDTAALSHSRGAQFALPLMDYGRPGIFLLAWSRR